MDKIIGIGQYAITNNAADVLKTFALSSCVALTVYSPQKVLGMVHIALPSSKIAPSELKVNPAYYADTAVVMLLEKACIRYGCEKEELELKLFGGAMSVRQDDVFHIGSQNVAMVKATLSRMNLKLCHTDVGGNISRSIQADAATGEVKVASQPLLI